MGMGLWALDFGSGVGKEPDLVVWRCTEAYLRSRRVHGMIP